MDSWKNTWGDALEIQGALEALAVVMMMTMDSTRLPVWLATEPQMQCYGVQSAGERGYEHVYTTA